MKKNTPNARIIFDNFHIMRHLSKALDEVWCSEYKRLSGKARSYIKGQRYTLLSWCGNLGQDGRRTLKNSSSRRRPGSSDTPIMTDFSWIPACAGMTVVWS